MRTIILLLAGALLATTAQGAIRMEPVDYRDGNVELRGWIAWDDAVQGQRPGILIAHEWWGLNDYVRHRAEMVARLGYVAFAMDMYGKDKVTEHGKDAQEWMSQITANQAAWVRRAQAGLNILRQSDKVDPERIGAIGYCFGGATVMQLAYAGADLKGVASFHGSLPPATEGQARAIKASLFAATGAADSFVPPERVQQFEAALEKSDVDWLVTTYAGARHGFTNPDAARYGMENIQYNAKADRRSWEAMKAFFAELFSSKPPSAVTSPERREPGHGRAGP